MIRNQGSKHVIRVLLKLCAILIMANLLTSCATLNRIIQKPTVNFRKMQITKADLVQSTAVFNFDVQNPNPIPIKANKITYDLKLNGQNFVTGILDQGLDLEAGKTSRLAIPITLPYLEFFKSIAQLWQTKSADYALTGGFAVGPFTIPFQAHGSFDLPKMPKISIEALQIQKLSLNGARLNCRLQMNNPNAFDLLLKRLDYHLNLGKITFAQASARSVSPLKKNSSAIMNLAFDVSFAKLGHTAYQLLQGQKADFTLTGGLIFDGKNQGDQKVPFNLSGQVPVVK
jgi:LEA14-like dessication related protein